MTCLECHKEINNNAIYCTNCKNKITEQLYCCLDKLPDGDHQYVFGVYSVMNNWDLLDNVVSVYRKDRLELCSGRTVEQQRRFISDAYDEYIQNPKDWSTMDLNYYKGQIERTIKYIISILKS